MPRLTTEQYRKLLREKLPEESRSDEAHWLASMLLAFSESLEDVELALAKTQRALRLVADHAGYVPGKPKAEAVEGEEGGAAASAAPAADGPRDQTPFPAGLKTSPHDAAPVTPAAPAAEAPPAPAQEAAPAPQEIPQPDVVGGAVKNRGSIARNGKPASSAS